MNSGNTAEVVKGKPAEDFEVRNLMMAQAGLRDLSPGADRRQRRRSLFDGG